MSRFFEIDLRGKQWLHRVEDSDTHNHAGDDDEGRVIYSEDDKKVYLGNTITWNLVTTPYDVMAQNTKILMGTFPLPTGWNLDTTYNDISVIVTSTIGDIGTSGGSWTINDMNASDSHDHSTGNPTANLSIGASDIYTICATRVHRHNITDDDNHFHFFDGAWRWPHTHYCVAEYQ